MKTPGNIMVKFKSRIENDEVIEEDKLADYIKSLYKDPEDHDILEVGIYTGSDDTTIDEEDINWAREKLA